MFEHKVLFPYSIFTKNVKTTQISIQCPYSHEFLSPKAEILSPLGLMWGLRRKFASFGGESIMEGGEEG